MKKAHKTIIAQEIGFLIEKSSANKVAVRAKVSPANISQIVNGNWSLISDALWEKIKTNLSIDWNWKIAITQNIKTITELLASAQNRSMSICICDKAGLGKTTGYKVYQRENRNVILIRCKHYWTKKSFVRYHLLACGLPDEGTVEEMIERFQDYIKRLKRPQVIYDQFDKLKEAQKDLFMDHYDELDGACSFVLSGVPHLKKQEEAGRRRDKMGYKERHSRYGSKYISLDPLSYQDVKAMCIVNGVTDEEMIGEIFENCLGDGRRVKREVEKYFLTLAEKVA